jgi:hypothetical protein
MNFPSARLLTVLAFTAATAVACGVPAELSVRGNPRAITDVSAYDLGQDEDGRDLLTVEVFSDPSQMVSDDELTVIVNLAITDLDDLPLGEDIELDGERVQVTSFEYGCFCAIDEPAELGTGDGTLRLDSVADGEIRGFLEVRLEGEDTRGNDMGEVELRVPFTAVPGATTQD